MDPVVVIGSGPSGLAAAAELLHRDVPVTVLERGERLGAAWAGHYDGLRFNTSRWWSALPGARFPREYGWFPTRDQYLTYLEGYAAQHQVRVRTGITVTRLDPAEGGWSVSTDDGTLQTRHVVVAAGLANEPVLPDWASGTAYPGAVVHSSAYRNAAPYRGMRVLVVGAGSSGMEIAHELAVGGAGQVLLSVRTPPNILLRRVGGLPGDLPVPLFMRLPVPLVDVMQSRMQRTMLGDLSPYGLHPPPAGALAQLYSRGAGTAVVDRDVIDAIRDGSIRVVAAVESLDATGAGLADGSHVEVDAVVAATGYGPGLAPMVGHLGVLQERGTPRAGDGSEVLPGLRFLGYVYRPGLTGYVGKLARRAAHEVACPP